MFLTTEEREEQVWHLMRPVNVVSRAAFEADIDGVLKPDVFVCDVVYTGQGGCQVGIGWVTQMQVGRLAVRCAGEWWAGLTPVQSAVMWAGRLSHRDDSCQLGRVAVR